ncbi:MAG: S8 family serine peptidase [Thermoflexales bacterium]|nr:S8 family serine peptidase [Thermoflexales bacterium]
MKRTVLVIVILIALGGAPAQASPTEWLLHFNPERAATPDRVFRDHQLIVLRHIPRIDVWVVAARSGAAPLESIRSDPAIDWIEANGWVRASDVITPDDTFYVAQQWPYLNVMRVPEAWALTTGDSRPVAVIDTGISITHPDLTGKIWSNPDEIAGNGLDDDANGYVDDAIGWNFVSNTNNVQDNHSHGSHVSGSIAASANNGQGIAGLSWAATLMPIKALGSNAAGTWANIAAAIIYAADEGARIINLSLGDKAVPPQTLRLAVSYAQSKGCLLIAAAGNDGTGQIEYPAALPGVLAVASTELDDTRSDFSNYGADLDVSAPGRDIFSASSTGSYYANSGTSMSAAHVSGLAALIWSMRPDYAALTVAQTITLTAQDIGSIGWDAQSGWGRIDALAAVRHAQQGRIYLPVLWLNQ